MLRTLKYQTYCWTRNAIISHKLYLWDLYLKGLVHGDGKKAENLQTGPGASFTMLT